MKKLILGLLILISSLCEAQTTSSIGAMGFNSYKFTQTTDGTNDYYVGINGTSGFVITPFQGRENFAFNILINFPAIINSATAQKRLFEIANTDRSSVFVMDVGAFSSLLTSEYIGFTTSISGSAKTCGVTTGGGSIATGWHMITISVDDTDVFLAIDGIDQTLTNGTLGKPVGATNQFTANRLSIMASTSGSVPTGATWRDAVFLSVPINIDNAEEFYGFYTRDGNVSLANTDRSFWRHYTSSITRPGIIAFYPGKETGTDLNDFVSSDRDLTKTNF